MQTLWYSIIPQLINRITKSSPSWCFEVELFHHSTFLRQHKKTMSPLPFFLRLSILMPLTLPLSLMQPGIRLPRGKNQWKNSTIKRNSPASIADALVFNIVNNHKCILLLRSMKQNLQMKLHFFNVDFWMLNQLIGA